MRRKQIVILFSALILPVSIFLFLKFFGKNEFDVAPLYQEGTIPVPADCNTIIRSPYKLADSIMDMFTAVNAPLYLLNFSDAEIVNQRVVNEIGTNEIAIVFPSAIMPDSLGWQQLTKCILLLSHPNDMVLVDNEKRIRGYYNGHDRDDVDRLLVEINIILKKY